MAQPITGNGLGSLTEQFNRSQHIEGILTSSAVSLLQRPLPTASVLVALKSVWTARVGGVTTSLLNDTVRRGRSF